MQRQMPKHTYYFTFQYLFYMWIHKLWGKITGSCDKHRNKTSFGRYFSTIPYFLPSPLPLSGSRHALAYIQSLFQMGQLSIHLPGFLASSDFSVILPVVFIKMNFHNKWMIAKQCQSQGEGYEFPSCERFVLPRAGPLSLISSPWDYTTRQLSVTSWSEKLGSLSSRNQLCGFLSIKATSLIFWNVTRVCF